VPVRICVYCGSNPGRGEAYTAAARKLGALLAAQGIGLVYGGASVGTMGTVADAAMRSGGEVIGVLPRALQERELAHTGLSELHIVADLHERKARMAGLSDAFIALPGGIGTLEELFEMWTWGHLGLHDKPLGVLDLDGFYAPLRTMAEHMVTEGFLAPASRDMLLFDSDPGARGRGRAGDGPVLDVLAWATVREGRMLAARTHGSDAFYLPGGKREAGEDDADALIREVKEETGVRLDPQSVRPFTVAHAAAHGYAPGTRVRLAAMLADGEGEPCAQGEIAELAWLDYSGRERCAPGVQVVMDRLRARGLL
jgi:uncharacterized protein (TIGR00730 family)